MPLRTCLAWARYGVVFHTWRQTSWLRGQNAANSSQIWCRSNMLSFIVVPLILRQCTSDRDEAQSDQKKKTGQESFWNGVTARGDEGEAIYSAGETKGARQERHRPDAGGVQDQRAVGSSSRTFFWQKWRWITPIAALLSMVFRFDVCMYVCIFGRTRCLLLYTLSLLWQSPS